MVDAYEGMLRRIHAEGLQTNVALKLTHLGVLIDEELAYANLERLVAEAGRLGNFIRIDMEESPLVDITLRIYRRLREAGHDNVGTVLQAYLYRSEARPGIAAARCGRTCGSSRAPTGSRRESPIHGRRTSTRPTPASSSGRSPGGGFTAVATHDERLIEHAIGLAPAPTASSSRCSTASARSSSSTSCAAATGCWSRLRTARTGTRT